MSIWEIRQWIETRTPWWTLPASILLVAFIYGWVDFNSHRKRKF